MHLFGDNGIISNAQNAKIKNGMAILEEHLQEEFIKHYDTLNSIDNKVVALSNLSKYSEYFYNPSKDGDTDGTTYGSISYVVDSDGHALYLIKKSGLPDEVRKQLVGGNAGEGNYIDYVSLNDVYGVTSNLEVYYCSNGISTITGISLSELDMDDINRTVVITNSGLSSIFNNYKDENGKLTAQSLRSVKTLTIDSSVTSLSDLYNLTSLQELVLDNATLSLNGLENCVQLNYICFKNYTSDTITNYASISKVNKLKYLYLINSCDNQVNSVFTTMKNTNYSNLEYIGVYDSKTNVTDISVLSDLTVSTKTSVKYLDFHNNNLISLLSLSGFINVYEINVYNNKNLTTLAGLEEMTNLAFLKAYNCNLGANEIYDSSDTVTFGQDTQNDSLAALSELTKLYNVNLESNVNLKWVSYLSKNMGMYEMNLTNDEKIVDLVSIKPVLKNCYKYYIPTSFSLAVLDENTTVLDLSSQRIKVNNFRNLAGYQNLNAVRLDNIMLVKDDLDNEIEISNEEYNTEINYVLNHLVNMKHLSLTGINGLYSIEFVKNMTNLDCLDLTDTSVITEMKNDSEEYIGLELLNTNCSHLGYLRINNKNINLGNLSEMVNKIGKSKEYSYWRGNDNSGLDCENSTIAKTLENCTNIEYIALRHVSKGLNEDIVDLSNFTELKQIIWTQNVIDLKLPSTLKTGFSSYMPYCKFDFSACTYIGSFYITGPWKSSNRNYPLESLSTISKNLVIDSLNLTGNTLNSFNSLDYLKYFQYANCSEVYLGEGESVNKTGLIDFLSESTNLKILEIKNCNYLNSLEALKKCTNLERLVIINSGITSLKPLENLIKLKYLDLRNGAIYDISDYTDDNGNKMSYKNLEIIANLKNNHLLTKVYLEGNTGIMDWTPVSSISGWQSSTYSGW